MPARHVASSLAVGRERVYLGSSSRLPSRHALSPRRRRSGPPAFASPFAPWISPWVTPWTRVLDDAAVVIPLRVAHTAALWGADPRRALTESGTMVTEKQAALAESAMELALAPWRLWLDLVTLSVAPTGAGLDRAARDVGRRVAAPYARRAGANRRRLVRGR